MQNFIAPKCHQNLPHPLLYRSDATKVKEHWVLLFNRYKRSVIMDSAYGKECMVGMVVTHIEEKDSQKAPRQGTVEGFVAAGQKFETRGKSDQDADVAASVSSDRPLLYKIKWVNWEPTKKEFARSEFNTPFESERAEALEDYEVWVKAYTKEFVHAVKKFAGDQ